MSDYITLRISKETIDEVTQFAPAGMRGMRKVSVMVEHVLYEYARVQKERHAANEYRSVEDGTPDVAEEPVSDDRVE